jgi:hypothetical protein
MRALLTELSEGTAELALSIWEMDEALGPPSLPIDFDCLSFFRRKRCSCRENPVSLLSLTLRQNVPLRYLSDLGLKHSGVWQTQWSCLYNRKNHLSRTRNQSAFTVRAVMRRAASTRGLLVPAGNWKLGGK